MFRLTFTARVRVMFRFRVWVKALVSVRVIVSGRIKIRVRVKIGVRVKIKVSFRDRFIVRVMFRLVLRLGLVYSNNFFIPKSKTFKDFPLSIDIRTISSGWLSPTDIASSPLHLFTDFCGVPTKICWAL